MNRLKDIKKYDVLIKEKTEEIDRLKLLVTKVNYASDGERVQSSGSGDKVGDITSMIVDLEAELNEDIKHLVELKRECVSLVDQLENPTLIQLAYKRYFEFKTFEQVAEEMDLSVRWVLKLNKKLLKSSC